MSTDAGRGKPSSTSWFRTDICAEALSLLQNYGDEGGYGNAVYAARKSDQGPPLLPHEGLSVLAGRGLS
jgi:hypothetical protein